jgi:hypothetical protein
MVFELLENPFVGLPLSRMDVTSAEATGAERFGNLDTMIDVES